MKRNFLLLLFLSLVLASCHQSFYNTRQHAHRTYIKIGPDVKNENIVISKEENTTQLIRDEKGAILIDQKTKLSSNNGEINSPSKPVRQAEISGEKLKKNVEVQQLKVNKQKRDIHKSKAKKEAGPVLNIFSFVLSLLSMILFFATGIVLLISLLEIAFLATGIAMLWICFGMALLGIVFGVLGLSLKHPSKGLGIAGVVMGGIVFFSILLVLIIMAAV